MNNFINTGAAYYPPSAEIEKRTHAMNGLLWGFVFMGIFIVWFFFWIIDIIAAGISGLSYTLLQGKIIAAVLVPVIFIIIGVILGRRFTQQYLISYKFEAGRITKGKIKSLPAPRASDAVAEGAGIVYMAANFGNVPNMQLGYAAASTYRYSRLKKLNADFQFVSYYFDSDVYKKKIFINPVLIKETKSFLVFSCSGGKKFKIRKIYEMPQIRQYANKRNSISARIAKRIAICAAIVFCVNTAILIFLKFLL